MGHLIPELPWHDCRPWRTGHCRWSHQAFHWQCHRHPTVLVDDLHHGARQIFKVMTWWPAGSQQGSELIKSVFLASQNQAVEAHGLKRP